MTQNERSSARLKDALEPIAATPSSSASRYAQALLAPFTAYKGDSTRILSESERVTPKIAE